MTRSIICLLTIAALAQASCGFEEDKAGEKERSDILRSPAVKGLTDSIKLFPDNPDLYFRRARLLSHNNYQELATPDYKKTWELTRDEGVAQEYISNLLVVNRVNEAEKLLHTARTLFPGNTEFGRRLAEIYVQQNQSDRATAQYDSILTRDPENFEAWYEKGSLLAQSKDTAGAIGALEKSFAIMPINYSGLALVSLYTSRKNPRALVICDQLIARDSAQSQTEPIFMKGVYYSETRQYAEAIKQFDLCIKRDWKLSDAYIEKGIIYYEQKNYPEALRTFELAITVSNTDPDAYYWLGKSNEATGDYVQARLNYERALSLDNSFSEARQALRRLNR